MRESAADKNIDIHEILGALNEIKDPRRSPATRHIFHEMLFMSLAAVIAGAEGFVDIELFSKSKKEWLESFLELPHGIPSHDAFGVTYLLS